MDVAEILKEPIEWTGDLNDDCVARWRGLLAHAEAMNKGVDKNGMSVEWWYFAVCREGEEDDIVHSTSDEMSAATGEAARRICEVFMRLAAVGLEG